ncbi:MAG: hypothetical protein ACI9WU_000530 [Myxococcota bacterium]|jgi:hypothetical protein
MQPMQPMQQSTNRASVLLFVSACLVSSGCSQKSPAPEKQPEPPQHAKAPAEQKDPAPTPPVPAAEAEPEGTGDDEGDDFDETELPELRGRFGPAGTHLLKLVLSKDRTDVAAAVTLEGGRTLPLGTIQPEYADQIVRVTSAVLCSADADPECEVCLTYTADPLGSLREDTYTEQVVVDWKGGKFVVGRWANPGKSPASAACPASPRTGQSP